MALTEFAFRSDRTQPTPAPGTNEIPDATLRRQMIIKTLGISAANAAGASPMSMHAREFSASTAIYFQIQAVLSMKSHALHRPSAMLFPWTFDGFYMVFRLCLASYPLRRLSITFRLDVFSHFWGSFFWFDHRSHPIGALIDKLKVINRCCSI